MPAVRRCPPLDDLNGGPGALLTLNEADGSKMKVALLPYRAFGFNQFHGADVVKGSHKDHLVEHQFFGSWKTGSHRHGK